MPTWSYTHIEKTPGVTQESVREFISSEPKEKCSLARDNGQYWYQTRTDSDWVLISPNGFASSTEKYAESCRLMSRHFDCRVIMTMGQGNCSGMVFGVYDKGQVTRVLSAADFVWCENIGQGFDWEPEIFGAAGVGEAKVSEYTLEKVADLFGLPGYKGSREAGYWDINEKVVLAPKGPLPLPPEPGNDKKPWWKFF